MIVTFSVSDRLSVDGQRRRRLQPGRTWFIQQVAQSVKDVGLGQHTTLDGLAHSLLDEALIVLQHQGQNIGHLPITARLL